MIIEEQKKVVENSGWDKIISEIKEKQNKIEKTKIGQRRTL